MTERIRFAARDTALHVRRATLDVAPLIVAALEPVAVRCGYLVALYGSTLKHGEGRDFDLMLVPLIPGTALPADAVRDHLAAAGLVVSSFQHGLDGRTGIVGTFQGYAIDITVRP